MTSTNRFAQMLFYSIFSKRLWQQQQNIRGRASSLGKCVSTKMEFCFCISSPANARSLVYTCMYIFCVVNKTACLPEVAHVEPGAENAHQLIFVVVNVSLHYVHARPHQTLKRLHVQNCRELKSIKLNKSAIILFSLLFKKKKNLQARRTGPTQ